MTTPTRTAEEWGRVAMGLPGWRWQPGMCVRAVMEDGSVDEDVGIVIDFFVGMPRVYWPNLDDGRGYGEWSRKVRVHDPVEHIIPVFDHDSTAGCLLALLGPNVADIVAPRANEGRWVVTIGGRCGIGSTLGRACIAVAEAIGRWPGGAP